MTFPVPSPYALILTFSHFMFLSPPFHFRQKRAVSTLKGAISHHRIHKLHMERNVTIYVACDPDARIKVRNALVIIVGWLLVSLALTFASIFLILHVASLQSPHHSFFRIHVFSFSSPLLHNTNSCSKTVSRRFIRTHREH